MTRLRDLHEKWLKEPEYREEFERLGPEFELARALIEARAAAGLTQAELAQRMGTTQSVIAGLEAGRVQPTTELYNVSPGPPAAGSRSRSSRLAPRAD